MIETLTGWFPALGSAPMQFAEAVMLFAGFAVVGFFIDSVVYRLVLRHAETISWKPGVELATGLHGLFTAIAVVFGASAGIKRLDVRDAATATLSTVIEVAAIVVVTLFAARVAARMIRAYTERDDARLPSSSIFVNLARAIIWVIGGVSILATLGISIAPLLTAMGLGGLAIGLALQSTLENVFSGIQVLLSGQLEIDDFIELETGEQGWVHDVTWRNTTIKLITNDLVIVPNATIAKSRIVNYTTMDEQHVLWLTVGVSYSSDLELVERVTLDVAERMQRDSLGAVRDYEPLLRFTDFGDSAIGLTVSLRADAFMSRYPLRHEFIKQLHARYAAEGIEIPFPQRVVHMAENGDSDQPG